LKNMRALNSSPQGLPPVSALVEQLQEHPKTSAGLLELRTQDGPVYLRPTGWQRFWLQRAFRHFRVLPPQLLGSRNQRRIADLLETSVVKPDRPVSSSEIFGVVAQVHAKSAFEISRVHKAPPAPPPSLALVVEKKATPISQPKLTVTPVKPASFVVQEGGLWQWIVAGLASAACIPLIMASVYGISTLSSTPEVSAHPAAAPLHQVAPQSTPVVSPALAPAVVPVVEKHKRRIVTESSEPVLVQASTSQAISSMPERRFVSELPPGHFAHPDMTGSLAGEVRLKATIGADGTVKQVTVLSGDPRLAQAAMRAVMRWHYNPNGDPVAAETEIRMRFFGTDGVSIASVAGPAS
jgi:TonB family protein